MAEVSVANMTESESGNDRAREAKKGRENNRVYATNETQLGTCPGRAFAHTRGRHALRTFCGFGVFELPYELECG
jgi:hypothetical protein